MNILFITNMFPPIRTGSSHYALNHAAAFHETGHTVTVLTVKIRGYDTALDKKYPFDVIRIPNLMIRLSGFDWFSITSLNIFNYFRVANIIKKQKIEIVHQVSHYLDTAIISRIVCPLLNVKYVVSIHSQLVFKSKLFKPFLKLADRLICGRFILPKSEKIISLDSEIERYTRERYRSKKLNEKIISIPHGINIKEKRASQVHDFKLRHKIVSLGHIIALRDRTNLIRAMKIIVAEYPNIQLEIIGQVYKEDSVRLVKDLNLENNVVFSGELSHEESQKRLLSSDIHAVWITSDYVGLGRSVSESMLLCVPVVNNSPENLLGANELKNMENIVLVDGDDIQDIAEKLLMLLKNEVLRKKIGLGGQKFICDHLNLEKTKDRLLALYKSVH